MMLMKIAVPLLACLLSHNVQAYPTGIFSERAGVTGDRTVNLANAACMIACIRNGLNEIDEVLDVHIFSNFLELDIEPLVDMFGNKTQFTAFCQSYSRFKSCHLSCPQSNLRSLVQSGQHIVDYFCVHRYNDIIEHFPCVLDVATNRACYAKGSTCHTYYAIMAKVASVTRRKQGDLFRAVAHQSKTTLATRRLFQQSGCHAAKCMADCHSPMVRLECGADADELLHDMVNRLGHDIAEFAVKYDFLDEIPAVCRLENDSASDQVDDSDS